jgi:hypothetical protein
LAISGVGFDETLRNAICGAAHILSGSVAPQ